MQTTLTLPTLKDGETYAGLLLAADGTPTHHLILLPGLLTDADWQSALDWAKSIGGELPTRQEQALLYANCKTQFEPRWYWSGEQHADDSGYAWVQSFGGGSQDDVYKSYKGRARAGRRLSI